MSASVPTATSESGSLLPPDAALAAQYADVLARLDSLTNYEKRLQSARAWGLERVHKVAERLGYPCNTYPTLHVTGTKGKGTTSHLLARLLQAGGRRVGLYTSPHVRDLRERIKLNGQPIDRAAFVRAFNTVWDSFPGLVHDHARPVSYFEMMTHTAFVAFAQAQVDIAVIEVGLGGTLDATNILQAPRACVLTPISLDHVKILGSTVEAIAADKSGIIKPGAQVVLADQLPGAAQVIRERAEQMACPQVWQLGREVTYAWRPVATAGALAGEGTAAARYEVDIQTPHGRATLPLGVPAQAGAGNVATAWSTLVGLNLAPPIATARAALQEFRVEGRFEQRTVGGRTWLFDGAHNVASTQYLAEAVQHAFPGRAITLIFGCMHDKDAPQMLALWRPHIRRLICARAQNHRASELTDLRALALDAGIPATDLHDGAAHVDLPAQIAQLASQDAAPLVIVTGSFYLVGDILGAIAP